MVELVAELGKERDAQLQKELAAINAKVGKLQREKTELQGEIADLALQIKRDRAARGVGDGAQLPPGIVRPRNRAAKRKPPSEQAAPP
jgi:septal ring factor EnvC (AmiA/AmiB activator)